MSTAIPVVICDDSSLARRQMARALDGWNVDIHFAEHGLQALELIRAGKADLLFLDLNMPIMDGYETLARIRRHDLPVMVIVVSGDIQPEAHTRVMAMGALDFIEKPTSPEVVAGVLERFGLLEALSQGPSAGTADEDTGLAEYYQEIANVAMGRAGDLLARLLNAFVNLPIPVVAFRSRKELDNRLHTAFEQEIQTITQGFIGQGIAGEALLMFQASDFEALKRLLQADDIGSGNLQAELLMELSNTLIGAFLSSFEQQLDHSFSRASPAVLDHFDGISGEKGEWHRALTIDIHYSIEQYNIQCDLMVVFTEDSTPRLQQLASYF